MLRLFLSFILWAPLKTKTKIKVMPRRHEDTKFHKDFLVFLCDFVPSGDFSEYHLNF